MKNLFARIHGFAQRQPRPVMGWPLRLAPRQRTYRCLLLVGSRRDPVVCTALSAEEAAKTVAWEALSEDLFTDCGQAEIRVHVLGEAEARSFHFSRCWRLSPEASTSEINRPVQALAG